MKKHFFFVKRFFKKIKIKKKYILTALKNIHSPKLGDIVFYQNVKCCLIQGVASPYWNLMPLTDENLSKEKRTIYKYIHEKEFKLQPLIKRFYFSFLFTYNFKMRYWFQIDLNM